MAMKYTLSGGENEKPRRPEGRQGLGAVMRQCQSYARFFATFATSFFKILWP